MPYYFLENDLVKLNDLINSLQAKVKEAGTRKAASVQGGDTFHDNAAFEEAEREQQMWSTRLRELIQIRNGISVVKPDHSKNDTVRIGTEVTLENKTTGETRALKIGSFMTFDDPNVMSYNSPLAKIVIGARVNDVKTAKIAGQQQEFRILAIK